MAEVRDEFLEAKKADGRAKAYLVDDEGSRKLVKLHVDRLKGKRNEAQIWSAATGPVQDEDGPQIVEAGGN